MLHEEHRRAVVEACQSMQRLGLVVGTAGNVSIRVGDHVVISPSGVDYSALTPQMVGVHDLDGTPVDATWKPSSELPLHLAVYHATPAGAITHNHAPASTALGLVCDEVPVSHYYSSLFNGPVRVAPYAHFGTPDLADNVARALDNRYAALMANHGAVTIGPTLDKAVSLLPYLEYICDVHLRAMATGHPIKVLDEQQVAHTVDALKSYGQ